MSYDNIDPRARTSTDTPLSEAGESSSEQAGAIIASLQQQQQQQQQQRSGNSTVQNIMMSKAEHEAIFGRPNSTPSNYCQNQHQEQLDNSGHRSIVAHEDDNVEYYDQIANNNNVQAPASATNITKNNQEISPNEAIKGRSPRFIPSQVSNIPPNIIGSTQNNTNQGQGNNTNVAPTALMIMRRRRSNSTDLNASLSSSGGKGGRSKKLDELNISNKSGGSSSQENKRSPKVSSSQHNQNLNDMNAESHYNAAIQQQQQVYNLMALSAAAQAAQQQQQQQQNATAMRYNSSLHSTIGGYPMGTPTQLTHPSVTLELIARDRARWEADYYNSSGGMDYGYDYGGGDNGGGYYGATPSFRTMSNGMGQQSQNAQRGRGDSISGQQQQQNLYLPKSLHQQKPQQQQLAQAQGPDLDNRGTSSVVKQHPQQEIQSSPHRSNKNRVFQERDYKNDRVWQEDDHTSTGITASPASMHDRRLTEKTSNRVNDKQNHQNQQSEPGVESSPKLPPVPQLQGSGGGNGTHQQATIPSHSHQVPLPQRHQVPLPNLHEGRQGGQFSMDQNPYQHHSAAGIVPTPGQYYNQNVPSTPVRERDPRERQNSDISSICGSVGGGAHGPVPVVYPNGTYGLIYPPTPGGIHHPLPPQQVVPPGLYQHDPRQQGGDMGWMNSQHVHQTMPPPQHSFDHGVKAVSPVDEHSHSNNSGSGIRSVKTSSSCRNLGSKPPSSSAPPQVQAPRRVSFGHLEVRTYETILGDNPSCSGGPSLGLGWRYDPNHDTISVDEYEAHLAHMHGLPAGTSYIGRPEDLVLHRIEREAILLNTGYTRQDLADSIRSLNKVKNKRRQTVHNLPVAYFEEKAEVVKRTLRRWVRKRERTRHMYEDWKKKCVEGTS